MSAQIHVPAAIPTVEVAAILRNLATLVEAGDSLEGWLEWWLPTDEDELPDGADPAKVHMVRAGYRVGNRGGQGGFRTIGTWVAAPRGREGMGLVELFNQPESEPMRWQPNGRPPVLVSDMDPEWRYNAARMLEREALSFASRLTWAEQGWVDGLDAGEMARESLQSEVNASAQGRLGDPLAWIRSTPLYRALVDGLPEGAELEALAERARHFASCPARTDAGDCVCEQIRAEQETAATSTEDGAS